MAKISEILLDAAKLLAHGDPTLPEQLLMPTDPNCADARFVPVTYCCWAICLAMGLKWVGEPREYPAAMFLHELGMPLNGAFSDMEDCTVTSRWEIQQTRYAWLQLAAQIAQEEGL